MKSVILKLKKSPLANYLSIMAILIEAGISSRYFLSFFRIPSPIFWSKISKSLFLKLTKFVNPEPSVVCNARRRFCPQWSPPLNSTASTNVSHIVAIFSWHSKYVSRAHSNCNSTPWNDLFDWTRQVGVDTKYLMPSVRRHSTWSVHRLPLVHADCPHTMYCMCAWTTLHIYGLSLDGRFLTSLTVDSLNRFQYTYSIYQYILFSRLNLSDY